MRLAFRSLLLSLTVIGCGGDGGNDPNEPFPDVAGVYELDGTFDDLPPADGNFEGTLQLTQASRESGNLVGSVTLIVSLDGDVFNISDDAVNAASVTPSGVIAFTVGDGSATWTFTGSASGGSIINGRHTLSSSSGSFSGDWRADAAASVRSPSVSVPRLSLNRLMGRLEAGRKEQP